MRLRMAQAGFCSHNLVMESTSFLFSPHHSLDFLSALVLDGEKYVEDFGISFYYFVFFTIFQFIFTEAEVI